jgi:YggT family protein
VITSILVLIIDTVSSFFAGLLLLRFWMQAVRVRPPLAFGQFMFRLTDWLVMPLRRLLPGLGGFDWASLFGALLIALLSIALQLAARSAPFSAPSIILLAVLTMVHWMVYGLIGLLFIEVIFSWVNPHAPIAPMVRAMNETTHASYTSLVASYRWSRFIALSCFSSLTYCVVCGG